MIARELEQSAGAGLSRRAFMQSLGAGLLITVTAGPAYAQRGRSSQGAQTIAARLHIGVDGLITVMTGKVEVGQGARTQLSQAAAEELRVAVGSVRLIMADTALTPDDGGTYGSRTTPSTVPSVRRAAAAAREILVREACRIWQVSPDQLVFENGVITHASTNRRLTYAELAQRSQVGEAFAGNLPADVEVTPVSGWKTLGMDVSRPNARDIVMGAHRFPSDITRPGMLYGRVLRAPAYGAALESVELAPAEAIPGVVAVHDGDFVGCAAPSSFLADQALAALEGAAKWAPAPSHSPSSELFAHLRRNARSAAPAPNAEPSRQGNKALSATYEVAYVQHAPLEPRAAVAEWDGDKVTVWTGGQVPTRVREQVAGAFNLPLDNVRVIVPDTGGGFGGKHSGEAAVEAARLARAAGRPVSLRWSREEEFTWAYFRPAALIDIRAELDAAGKITAWEFTNINAGGAGIETPYAIPNARSQEVACEAPLRQGSYRALAATANNFAREAFMDELAALAGADPLEFRLAHLDNARIRAALEAAALRFDWRGRWQNRQPNVGIGIACGTEKGSVVATCVEVEISRGIRVRKICEAFECGAIQNPANLRAQVEGCLIMGLGGALTEEIRFENGRILNANFRDYAVPRFADVPPMEIILLDRKDAISAGGGETPIIGIAPAIANAIYHATGKAPRRMPVTLDT